MVAPPCAARGQRRVLAVTRRRRRDTMSQAMTTRRVRTLLLSTLLVTASAPAGAQPADTRQAEIQQQQAAKAQALVPAGPNAAERFVLKLEPIVLAAEPTGFYPWFGSVLGGGWWAFGGGYRSVYADTGHVNIYAAWSLKNYRTLDAQASLPTFFDGRGRVSVQGKYLFADKVSFYGLGPDSKEEDRTSFTYEPTTVGARLDVEAIPYLFVGGGVGYERVETAGGERDPSVERLFTAESAPGLGQSPEYLVTSVSAAIDWRESPGYTTRGGLYRIEHRRYDDRSQSQLGFESTEVEVQQFLPILRANWVLAFRGLGTVTYGHDGGEVPYFMMPTLGSSRNLRGFSNRRFRDRNRILLGAEYRWRPSKFMDVAIFYDAGKVESHRSDLDLDGLQTSWGGGIRLHGPGYTALRVELARSREGVKFIFSGGPSF